MDGSEGLLARWISAVVIIGAGMAAGIANGGGWWVIGSVALSAAVDRFWWRRRADAAPGAQ